MNWNGQRRFFGNINNLFSKFVFKIRDTIFMNKEYYLEIVEHNRR